MGKPRGRTSGSERVKITKGVRKYAAEQGLTESDALESGMQEKSKQLVEQGAEIYVNG